MTDFNCKDKGKENGRTEGPPPPSMSRDEGVGAVQKELSELGNRTINDYESSVRHLEQKP